MNPRRRSARAHLLDLLVARVYRLQAHDRLVSALRFDTPHWFPVAHVHLERALQLERVAVLLEQGRLRGLEAA